MAKIPTKIKVNVKDSDIKSIEGIVTKAMIKKVKKNLDRIQKVVYQTFLSELKKNPIFSALKSDTDAGFDRSLRAELGLSKRRAQSAAKEIVDGIAKILENPTISNNGNIIIAFPDSETTEDMLSEIPSGSYISKTKSGVTEIPWMQWLLDRVAAPIDKQGRRWGIWYDLDDEAKRLSRSKKALMVSEPRKPTTHLRGRRLSREELRTKQEAYFDRLEKFKSVSGPYRLPARLINVGSGTNFVDKVFKSRRFFNNVKRLVQEEITNILKE